MLNVPDELKQDYFSDSVPKQLYISTDEDYPTKLDGINWYIGQYNGDDVEYTNNINVEGSELHAYTLNYLLRSQDVYFDYIPKSKYVYISFFAVFSNATSLPNDITLRIGASSTSAFQVDGYTTDDITEGVIYRFYLCIKNPEVITSINFIYLLFAGTVNATITCTNLQIESADEYYTELSPFDYYDGPIPYLGESIILNPSGYDFEELIHIHQPDINMITNTDLEAESFSMTESLTSADNLKFGACEASYVDFSIVGRTENWKDRYVRPYITTTDEPFNVSQINWFKGGRNTTPTQTQSYSYNNSSLSWNMSTDEHALAPNLSYGKFQSFNMPVLAIRMKIKFTMSNFSTEVRPYYIKFWLGYFYNGDNYYALSWTDYNRFLVSDITDDFITFMDWLPIDSVPEWNSNFPNISEISKLVYRFYDEEGNTYPSSAGTFNYTVEIKEIQINLCDAIHWTDFPEWSIDDCVEYNGISIDDYIIAQTGNIPLGRYKVTDIQEDYTHEFRRLSITAYDDLVKLDQNAADWYTLYMYLISPASNSGTIKASGAYVRQIFSSFWSIAVWSGLESRSNYDETQIYSFGWDGLTIDWNFQVYNALAISQGGSSYLLTYAYKDIDVTQYTSRIYCVDVELTTDGPDAYFSDYEEKVDSMKRGLTNAQVVIEERGSNGYVHKFCADAGDYFIVSDKCTTMRVYIPKGFISRTATQSETNLNNIINYDSGRIYNVDWEFDLENAPARISYYNISSLEIFACDSSITARDVARSILEMTGCFLSIDRDGRVKFKYVTKSALFPRDDLYPANNLYPKGDAAAMLYMSQYTYARYKPYKVQSIGRIQIVKQIRDNKAKSVCEWEYIGDPTSKQAYLIDDNIFYCNDAMEYDYDNMPDVADILEKLYNRISNISYTPNETLCVGLPWVETGDMVGVLTTHGGFESFVFRRTLKGIMALKDEYTAEGDEYVKPVNNYTYKAYLH